LPAYRNRTGRRYGRHPGGLGRADLVCQRTIEILLQYARMAVGIAGDADLADAMTLQRAAVDHLERAAEIACGLLMIAGNDQEAHHARLAAEAGEKVLERAGAGEAAGSEVRHRLEAGLAQLRCGFDRLLRRPLRHRADIHARPGGSDGGECRDLLRGGSRRFERKARHEIGNRVDRFGAVLDCGRGGRCGHIGHSRRREIT
jgi:hypothetical protein